MRDKLIILLSIFISIVVADIFLRMFYYSDLSLKFDSQEFNNIGSPIISFFGFIGLILTVKIALNQFRLQHSIGYFDYYRTLVNKILQENNENSSTIDLLQFILYVDDIYDDLKKNPSYLIDLTRFKRGEVVNSDGKDYDSILGKLRLFRIKLSILLKRYELLILEIKNHNELSVSHKDLLFKELFSNQITDYTVQLEMLDDQSELRDLKENLFIAFVNHSKEKLPFFNENIYALKKMLVGDPFYAKYLSGNAM